MPPIPPAAPQSFLAAFRLFQLARSTVASQRLHLPDGDLIEPFESVALRQAHMDELCVHAFDFGEH
jgi:hypothetical protein